MSFSDQRSASSPLEVLHEHVIQSLARKIPVDTQQIATLRVLQRDFSDRIADILACDIPPSDTFDQQV